MITEREKEILELIKENPMIKQHELAKITGIVRSSIGVHISNLMQKGYIAGKGYVIPDQAFVVVMGGANIDLIGVSAGKPIYEDSNLGDISLSLGGVGRNQSHILRLLGVDIKFITALGDDIYGNRIRADCANLGIDLSHALFLSDQKTSTYISLFDDNNNLMFGISDMKIYDTLTYKMFENKVPLINHAMLCSLDANMPKEVIDYIAEQLTIPLFVETISVAKAKKINGIIDKIHTLRTSISDLSSMEDKPNMSFTQLKDVVATYIKTGVKQVFVTLNKDEVYCANKDENFCLHYKSSHIADKGGARDAFMAALIWAYSQGLTFLQTANVAVEAANIYSNDSRMIEGKLSEQNLLDTMDKNNKL